MRLHAWGWLAVLSLPFLLGCPDDDGPVNPNFEVGINMHNLNGPVTDTVGLVGAKWVRVSVSWADLEPSPGVWNLGFADAVVSNASSKGYKIYFILAYAPSWASSNGQLNGIPTVAAWQNFVQKMVDHYGDDVDVWGIWNEPNLEKFWIGSTEDYVNVILTPAFQVIKSANPNYLVAGPDLAFLSNAEIKVEDFLEKMKSMGADTMIDILAQHCYGNSLATFKNRIRGTYVADVLVKNGIRQIVSNTGWSDKPVWLTEFGWDSLEIGENDQADRLADALKFLARRDWIDRAFLYELRDDPNYVNDFRWGLLRADGTDKPAVQKVKSTIESGFE